MFSSSLQKKLDVASDEFLDALYSKHCLNIDYYFVNEKYCETETRNFIPKYCNSFGRIYIKEKIKRVLKKNGNI